MALEEHAGISIAEEDAANLKTVGDIIAYLAAHKNERAVRRRGCSPGGQVLRGKDIP